MTDKVTDRHLSHARGTGQGEITIAKQRRCQGRANAIRIQDASQLDPNHQGVWLVSIQDQNEIVARLAQCLARVVLQAANIDCVHAQMK